MVKLNKAAIFEAIKGSDVLEKCLQLLKSYPWNNFLQLKVSSIFEDIIENAGEGDR
jgi:hypothetical protein